MHRLNFSLFLLSVFICLSCTSPRESSRDWVPLFDGTSLRGWQAGENPGSFRVEDGAIVCNGPRAHLFYSGEIEEADFQNFEFSAKVRTISGSNSGIYFHTRFQEQGWPIKGYEAQVLNSLPAKPGELGDYVEHKKTGSLYGVRNVWKRLVPDNEWFDYRLSVIGKTIRIWINEQLVVDYTESGSPPRPGDLEERLLSSGTFALQAHDPDSLVYFRDILVRPLPPDLSSPGTPSPDPDLNETFTLLGMQNIPLTDLHVHLKGGLTLEDALVHSRQHGLTYGIAVNCGPGMPYPDESSLREFLDSYPRPSQAYLAMQAEGREWLELFSRETIEQFDYVFTDAMTWTNDAGKRMRLWIPEEVEIGEPEEFMEMLVDRIENILDQEPIDIYVNPTYVPDEIGDRYDELWTAERKQRVIDALVRNGVAIEMNNARRIPSSDFIGMAKSAGVKLTCGTNNAGRDDLGHQEYCLEMIAEHGLSSEDFWLPDERPEQGEAGHGVRE